MMNIYDIQGNVILSVPILRESEHAEELMRTDEVRMFWNAADNATLPDGAYVIVNDEKYSLLEPYTPTQRSENAWRYEPVFVSRFYGLSKVPFYMYTYEGADVDGTILSREADWVLTDNPANFMSTLCRAIKNETGDKYTYAIGADLAASATVTFNSVDIISALNAIANAFKTEFWLEKFASADASGNIGKIHLSIANNGETTKVLTVGENVNVPSITEGREGFYNRFVILGSTRNITQDYQGAGVNSIANKRLTLDPTEYPNGFIDFAGTRKPFTKILTFDEIYPSASDLVITNVRARVRYVLDDSGNRKKISTPDGEVDDLYTVWYFQLKRKVGNTYVDFNFDDTTYDPDDNPDGMMLPGMKLSIHFNTGPLSGREFELTYHKTGGTQQDKADTLPFTWLAGDYEINYVTEGTYIIPAQTGLVPQDDNYVVLFNIRMPDDYTEDAQLRLKTAAFKEIGEKYIKLNGESPVTDSAGNLVRVDMNSYQFSSNPVAFASSNPNLVIGSAVRYVNNDYTHETRVTALVTKLDFPIRQTITIGNKRVVGTIRELQEQATNANQNIDLLAALNESTKQITDAYTRTQQMILSGMADDFFEENGALSSLVQLKTNYSYLGPKGGLFFSGATLTGMPVPDLYVDTVNGQRVLRSPLPLITGGDQIVIDGTPGGGGGGGGATMLRQLEDVYHNAISVLRKNGNSVANGDLLSYDSASNKWVALDQSTITPDLSNYYTKTQTDTQISSAITALNLGAASTYGVGTVTSGNGGLVTGGSVYSAINEAVSSVLKMQGTTTTAISDGSTTNPIVIDGSSYTAKKGDVVMYSNKEFWWTGSAWEELGDEASWALKTTTISAGTGLTGGGTLASNRTISLSDSTIASLALADSAYQKPSTGIPQTDLASALSTKVDDGSTAYGYFSNGILPYNHGGTGRSSAWTANSVIYASSTSVLGQVTNISGNNQKKFLVQTTNGSGTASAPTWGSIANTDLPSMYIGSTPVQFNTNAEALAGITSITASGLIKTTNYVQATRFYLTDSIYFYTESVGGTTCVRLNAPFITSGDQIVISGTPGGGGGGGATTLAGLDDTNINNPAATQVLQYLNGKWTNVNSTEVGVTTVATSAANGLMSAEDYNKLAGIAVGATAVTESTVAGWGFTKNTGTVTSVKVGSTTYNPTSGVVSLPAYAFGTAGSDYVPVTIGNTTKNVLTAHQTVTLASGTNNGTLKLTTAAGTVDNIAVKGLGSMAYKSSDSYLPLNGGTLSGLLLLNYANARIAFQDGSGTTLGVLGVRSANTLEFYDTAWRTVYHSGNLTQSVVTGLIGSTTYAPYNANGYLPLSAGASYPLTGRLVINGGNGIQWSATTEMTTMRMIGPNSTYSYDLAWYDGSWRKVYHSGNSNKSDVAWACSTLTANGNITLQGADRSILIGEAGSEAIVLRRNSSGVMLGGGTHQSQATIIYGTPLRFLTYSGEATVERMRILANGNVGIGKTDPTTTLYVNGTTYLNGDTTIPATASLKIGSATITWNSNGYLHIDKPLVTAGDQIVISGTPGGGGGATTLNGLDDVSVSSLANNNVLVWDSTLRSGQGAWKNVAASSIGGVTSVVGQTGAVTAEQIASALTSAGYQLTDTTYSQGTGISISGTTISLASTYAGGTAVTLNGASKAANTASFYAPTAGGAANKVLIGKGTTTAPDWSGFTLTGTANTAYNLADFLTGNQNITLSGDVSGSGTTSITTTIGTGKVTNAMLAGSIENSKLNTIGAAKGGTGLTTWTGAYRLIYSTAATTVTTLAPNTSATRKFLRMTGTGSAGAAPAWDTVTKTDVGLSNVENTALSSWAGTSSITTLGTITTGVWNGTAIANSYLANSAITINGTSTSLGGSFNTASITAGTAGQSTASSGLSISIPYVTLNAYGIATAYGTHTHTISAANITTAIGGTTYAPYNANGYLPLNGGTLTGELEFSHTLANAASIKYTNKRATTSAGNWGDVILNIVDADGTALSKVGIYGTANTLSYLYIGSNAASGVNLRISSTALTWGDNTIWHAGNFVAGTNYQAPMSQGTGITISNNQISVTANTYAPYNANGYLPLNGGTLSGLLLLNYANARIAFQDGSGTTLGVLGVRSAGTLEFYDMAAWRTVYHSNNSNLATVDWTTKILNVNGRLYMKGGNAIEFDNASGTTRGLLSSNDSKELLWHDGSWRTVYHSNNANKSDVAWTCSNLSAYGTITSTGDQVVSSDLTKKTNLVPIDLKVEQIAGAPAVTFDWKTGGHSFGSIAQYWKDVLGEAVLGTEGNYALAYGQLALVNTIVEAREIDKLKARVAELEAEVKRLTAN